MTELRGDYCLEPELAGHPADCRMKGFPAQPLHL